MLANQVRIAARRLRRQKLFAVINVAGLAAGLALIDAPVAVVLAAERELPIIKRIALGFPNLVAWTEGMDRRFA